MPTIRLATRIAAPAEICFDLSLDVDVHQQGQRSHGERAIAGVTTGRMKLGDTVTWEARHLGWSRRLSSRISAWERPTRFVDEFVSGDLAWFRHEHTFHTTRDGVTLMEDRFQFRAPLGPLGAVASAVFLTRYLRHLLRQRNATLRQLAERAARGEGRSSPSPAGDPRV